MSFYQNKKSQIKGFIIGIILLTASFLIIIAIIELIKSNAETKTGEAICRGSVALREKSHFDIREPVTPAKVKIGSAATPLFCKTSSKYFPEDKDATKAQVEKEIAGLMASCWHTFGEGIIQDVFKEGDRFSKNCFTCYIVNLRETSNFKGEIKSDEALHYLFENPYKVSPRTDNCKINGGFCIDSESKNDCGKYITADSSYLLLDKKNLICNKKSKKACCYTDYECWNKGGMCSMENPDAEQFAEYDKWECPSKTKCFVRNEVYYSYGDYIQRFGGPGNIVITTNIHPGETYAVSFGSPTGECSICTKIGLGTGAATVVGALALGVPTGGLSVVGAISVSVLFGTGYFAGRSVSEFTVQNLGELFDRKINTIYLTTLNQIKSGDYCSVIEDISGS